MRPLPFRTAAPVGRLTQCFAYPNIFSANIFSANIFSANMLNPICYFQALLPDMLSTKDASPRRLYRMPIFRIPSTIRSSPFRTSRPGGAAHPMLCISKYILCKYILCKYILCKYAKSYLLFSSTSSRYAQYQRRLTEASLQNANISHSFHDSLITFSYSRPGGAAHPMLCISKYIFCKYILCKYIFCKYAKSYLHFQAFLHNMLSTKDASPRRLYRMPIFCIPSTIRSSPFRTAAPVGRLTQCFAYPNIFSANIFSANMLNPICYFQANCEPA
jgi:hypothetical protein